MRIVLLCLKLHVFGSNGENILDGLTCNVDISRSMWECSNKNAHFPSFKICVQIGAVGSEQISLQCNQQSAYTINTMQCIGWWWEQDSQDNVISALTSEYRGLIALNTHNSHQAATSTPTPATQVNLASRGWRKLSNFPVFWQTICCRPDCSALINFIVARNPRSSRWNTIQLKSVTSHLRRIPNIAINLGRRRNRSRELFRDWKEQEV